MTGSVLRIAKSCPGEQTETDARGRRMSDARLPSPKCRGELPSGSWGVARLVASHLARSGRDPKPLLEKAGLPPSLLNAPLAQLGIRAQTRFLNIAAEALSDNLLGFHVARDGDLRELGPLYYLMASSETLAEALALEERYGWVLSEGVRSSFRIADTVLVYLEFVGVERRIARQVAEFWLTCTLRKARRFTGRNLTPKHAGFIHEQEGDLSEMERFFGVPPQFCDVKDRISFAKEDANLPFVSSDPYLSQLLLGHIADLAGRRGSGLDPLATRVENAITPRLPHGTATLATVAKDLGMSTRTLSRRLAQEGRSFAGVLDQLRRALASHYLDRHDLSISQIAWLLGYTDPSSFVRAVRRWTGKSPTALRHAARDVSTGASSRN